MLTVFTIVLILLLIKSWFRRLTLMARHEMELKRARADYENMRRIAADAITLAKQKHFAQEEVARQIFPDRSKEWAESLHALLSEPRDVLDDDVIE